MSQLVAPFPWFGGKRRAAETVWGLLGEVKNYIEPFGGSAAVLLSRPDTDGPRVETYNDLDGFLVNFWRAVSEDPEQAAHYADWPVSEADLSSRHLWLLDQRQRISEIVQADPHFYCPKVAGWWVWGACAWIGSGWCSGRGPWQAEGGRLVKLPHLGNRGKGINRQLPHLGDRGQGILEWFLTLQTRLRDVRITCGDWERVVKSKACVERFGVTGVFMDPPYPQGFRKAYSVGEEGFELWPKVKARAADLSSRGVRVVVAGYEGTWDSIPDGWTSHPWKALHGYARTQDYTKETLFASPECNAGGEPNP